MTLTVLICLVAVLGFGIFAYKEQQKQRSLQVTAGNSHDVGSSYRNITYKGEEYRYNNLVTNVLYAGIDSDGVMKATAQYGNKARADSIALVVMDRLNEKLTVLYINRDTMTKIRSYSLNGNDNGLYTSHIGYAYSYGDGGKVSCEGLCEAVSLLLGNIPVKRYVVTNKNSMPYINQLVGGITLTVPNDDLEEQYPEFARGAVVTLNEKNVSTFLQYRDTEEEFSNEGRMERQRAYVTAYVEAAQQMNYNELESAWNSLEDMEDYLQTSITRSQYLDLAEHLSGLSFTEEDCIQLEGEDQQGELHDEFYVDEEALQELIIRLFYIKV
jgi:anionic cell wall polymer biosynthesis LytR-Cps2A-Psr (LCP) family protein